MRAHLLRTAFTEEQYFALDAASPEKHEFIDGGIYGMAGGTEEHALVGANAIRALGNGVAGGPCRAYSSDLRVWSPALRAYVYPDATVICGPVERSDRKSDRLSVRNPVLIVEVVSPGSEDYDRTDKVTIYRAIPSLRDYLIVDVDGRLVEHHARDDHGAWSMTVVSVGAVSPVGLPFTLPLSELFAGL